MQVTAVLWTDSGLLLEKPNEEKINFNIATATTQPTSKS